MFEAKIIDHAESYPETEVCGFIFLNNDLTVSIERAKNESKTPGESFLVSPSRFINRTLSKRVLGLYHSHPKSSENPSSQDISMSEEMGIPYLIYSLITKNFYLYYPESYSPESLIGRPYVKGFFECTCVFKDYFYENLGINITKWNENYWLPEGDREANSLLLEILDKKLKKVQKEKIKKHDVILFEVKKGKRFHVGMYCGNDNFMHQVSGTLSQEQVLDNRWQSKIKEVYRHPSLV
jgi:proteasome lid subunit RPN8/RPN11